MKQNRERLPDENGREGPRSTVTLFIPRARRSVAAGQPGAGRFHGVVTPDDGHDDDPGPSAA